MNREQALVLRLWGLRRPPLESFCFSCFGGMAGTHKNVFVVYLPPSRKQKKLCKEGQGRGGPGAWMEHAVTTTLSPGMGLGMDNEESGE